MHINRLGLLGALLLPALLSLSGCNACRWQSCYVAERPRLIRRSAVLPPHRLTPCETYAVAPAPPCPPAQATVPPPRPNGGFQPLPPGGVEQAGGVPPGARLNPPEFGDPGKRESARLLPPESPEPPKTEKKEPPEKEPGPSPSPSLPVGIPGFAEVKPGVSTGQRPLLDGLDWLQRRNYRSTLYLRRPGEDDATDRRELETRRALRYTSLEVSPQTLTPALVKQFNDIVGNPGNHPLFVYASEPLLAGALWYLHFRTVDKIPDAEARSKAAALGLKEEDGENREMWLAIQKYLRDEMP